MYEKTLSIDTGNAVLLQHIDNNIASIVSSLGGVVAHSSSASRHYMAVAMPDCYSKQMDDVIAQLVADILTISYKHQFLSDKLPVSSGFMVRTLIGCMSIFDSQVDKQQLPKSFVGSVLAIDGYYHFNMPMLRSRWAEVVELVASNADILSDSDTILQFIGYMVEGVARSSVLSVSIGKGGYLLFDKKDNILPNTNIPLSDATVCELAMLDILLHNPKQLHIYIDSGVDSSDMVSLCKQLYPCKLYQNS